MDKCCECGIGIEEDSSEAILDVPFGEEIIHFCCKKCYDDATKI